MSPAVFRSRWVASAVLIAVAVGQILHRTPPVRSDSFFFDFSNVYSASRAWISGQNPYRIETVLAVWSRSRHGTYLGTSRPEGMQTWAAVYPPSSLLVFAPFAMFRAVPAHLLWMALNCVLLAFTFPALFALAGLRSWSLRIMLIAATLASAPVQGALGSGQPALPACSLLIFAVWAYSRNKISLATVLLGLSAAVKIQIGGPFLLYYLFLRQWRLVSLATLLFLALSLLSIARMEWAGNDHWATDWQRNIAVTLEPKQINDPRPGGPFRNDMVNMQTLMDVVIHNEHIADAMVVVLLLPMVTLFFSIVRPARAAGSDLLKLSIVGLISMLPLYHRLYDCTLLMMLLAWALANLDGPRRGPAMIALALLGELLVPIDLIPALLHRTHLFDNSTSSMWWQGLVVPHHAWGILFLSTGSLALLRWVSLPHPAIAAAAVSQPDVSVAVVTPTHSA
jgi:hypothetical protein